MCLKGKQWLCDTVLARLKTVKANGTTSKENTSLINLSEGRVRPLKGFCSSLCRLEHTGLLLMYYETARSADTYILM